MCVKLPSSFYSRCFITVLASSSLSSASKVTFMTDFSAIGPSTLFRPRKCAVWSYPPDLGV